MNLKNPPESLSLQILYLTKTKEQYLPVTLEPYPFKEIEDIPRFKKHPHRTYKNQPVWIAKSLTRTRPLYWLVYGTKKTLYNQRMIQGTGPFASWISAVEWYAYGGR